MGVRHFYLLTLADLLPVEAVGMSSLPLDCPHLGTFSAEAPLVCL